MASWPTSSHTLVRPSRPAGVDRRRPRRADRARRPEPDPPGPPLADRRHRFVPARDELPRRASSALYRQGQGAPRIAPAAMTEALAAGTRRAGPIRVIGNADAGRRAVCRRTRIDGRCRGVLHQSDRGEARRDASRRRQPTRGRGGSEAVCELSSRPAATARSACRDRAARIADGPRHPAASARHEHRADARRSRATPGRRRTSSRAASSGRSTSARPAAGRSSRPPRSG